MTAPSFLGSRAPASIRFNNPGAQYPGPSARKFGSIRTEIIGGGHKIAVFPDAIHGAAAHLDLLHRAYTGMTLGAAIKKWSGGNSVSTYLAVVRKYTSLTSSDTLSKEYLEDPGTGVPFAKAMAHHEAGKTYPLTDEEWRQAHKLAFPYIYDNETVVVDAEPLPAPSKPIPKASRKWNLLQWLKGLFGLGATGTAGYSVMGTVQDAQSVMLPLKAFISEWGVPVLIVVCVGGFILSQLGQLFIQEDYEDGRYEPKGD